MKKLDELGLLTGDDGIVFWVEFIPIDRIFRIWENGLNININQRIKMKPSIRVLFFTILILSTFVFAGCPVVKKKELPPPPEPVMEAAPAAEEDY